MPVIEFEIDEPKLISVNDQYIHPVIKTKKIDSNNIYTIEYDLISYDYDSTYEGTYKIVCELKNIDGKKQWSFQHIK